ncbi:MAG: GNAT family N-acetyltransferase [Nitrospiria bacterium]
MSWRPPPLTTERLYLAAPDDTAQPVFSPDGGSALEQELPGLPSNWKIFVKESDEPIGSIGFIRWEGEARLGELGFILSNKYTGRGYMTESCKAVLAFGLDRMGLETIEAKSLPNNAASLRVLEKAGMVKKDYVRARLWSKGPLVDLERFVLTKDVFQSGDQPKEGDFGRGAHG